MEPMTNLTMHCSRVKLPCEGVPIMSPSIPAQIREQSANWYRVGPLRHQDVATTASSRFGNRPAATGTVGWDSRLTPCEPGHCAV